MNLKVQKLYTFVSILGLAQRCHRCLGETLQKYDKFQIFSNHLAILVDVANFVERFKRLQRHFKNVMKISPTLRETSNPNRASAHRFDNSANTCLNRLYLYLLQGQLNGKLIIRRNRPKAWWHFGIGYFTKTDRKRDDILALAISPKPTENVMTFWHNNDTRWNFDRYCKIFGWLKSFEQNFESWKNYEI